MLKVIEQTLDTVKKIDVEQLLENDFMEIDRDGIVCFGWSNGQIVDVRYTDEYHESCVHTETFNQGIGTGLFVDYGNGDQDTFYKVEV